MGTDRDLTTGLCGGCGHHRVLLDGICGACAALPAGSMDDLFKDTTADRAGTFDHQDRLEGRHRLPDRRQPPSKADVDRERLEYMVDTARRCIKAAMDLYPGTSFTEAERIEAAARNVVDALRSIDTPLPMPGQLDWFTHLIAGPVAK